MPAAGTLAPEPDSTWPLAQPSSCTFDGSVALSDPPPRAQQILRRLEGNESRKNQAGGPHSKVCLFRSRRIALKVDLTGSLAVSDLDDGSMQQCLRSSVVPDLCPMILWA